MPTVTITPNPVIRPATVNVDLTGFVKGTKVTVKVDGITILTGRIGRSGALYQAGISIGSTSALGTHHVYVYNSAGTTLASTTFIVQDPVVVTPDPLALPPVKAGWSPVLTETFDKSCLEGQFAATYPLFTPYGLGWNDTSHKGKYNPNIASVSNGLMNIRIRSMGGVPQVFAMTAKPAGFSTLGGATKWRVETIIRSDRLYGYKAVPMGWTDTRHQNVLYNYNGTLVDLGPDYPKWLDGEIDYLEGNLDGSLMRAYLHYNNVNITVTKKADGSFSITPNETYQESADLGINLDNWHHIACEYIGGPSVEIFVDGVSKKKFVNRIPTKPFHMNWQFETNLTGQTIDPATTGNIQIAAIRVSV